MLDFLLGLALFVIALTVPGYYVAAGLFPRKGELDLLERAAFSVVFSLVSVPLLMLASNLLLGVAINQATVLVQMLLVCAAGWGLYFHRTRRLDLFPKVI